MFDTKLAKKVLFSHFGDLLKSPFIGFQILKKLNRAVLAKQLEAKVSPTEEHPNSSAVLIDAMGLIQKLH